MLRYEVNELIQVIKTSGIPIAQVKMYLQLAEAQDLSGPQHLALLTSPCLPALMKAAKLSRLDGVDMANLYKTLNLLSRSNIRLDSWRDEGNWITFSVTSDGTTGAQWLRRFDKKGLLGGGARAALCSKDFNPTSGVTTEIAVLKGHTFAEQHRNRVGIRARAAGLRFMPPHAETACLIREKFSNEEIRAMNLRGIIIMHEPVSDFDEISRLFNVTDEGWLFAHEDYPNRPLPAEFGYAFAISQVGPQQEAALTPGS